MVASGMVASGTVLSVFTRIQISTNIKHFSYVLPLHIKSSIKRISKKMKGWLCQNPSKQSVDGANKARMA